MWVPFSLGPHTHTHLRKGLGEERPKVGKGSVYGVWQGG